MGKTSKLANIGVILATGIILSAIFFSVKTCTKKPEVDPAKDRLEKLNDSLFHQLEINSGKIDGLHIKLDSLNILSDTLLNKQTIVNEYHRNEVYNILSSDAKSNNRRLSETFKLSDSLLKSGFYTRTIKFPDTTY